MYNETRKHQWFETMSELSAKELKETRSLFEKIAPIEIEIGKDFSDMNNDEKKRLVSSLTYKTYTRARQDIARLNRYLLWYSYSKGRQLPTSEKVVVQDVSLDVSIEQNFKTEEDLYKVIRDRPFSSGSIISLLCALAWCGFTPKAMCSLNKQDVIINENKLVICGREIPSGPVSETIASYAQSEVFGDYRKTDEDKFTRRLVLIGEKPPNTGTTTEHINAAVRYYNKTSSSSLNIVLSDISKVGCCYRAIKYEQDHPGSEIIPYEWVRDNTVWHDYRAYQDFRILYSKFKNEHDKRCE